MIWLLGLLLQIKLVFGTSGECDPDLNKHWYPVQNESTKFFFCHPTKKVYQLDECGSESGIQKEFDFLLQKCALRNKTFNSNLSNNTLSHPPRHSFGTIPNLSTIGQKILGRLPEPPRTRYEFDELQCPQGRNALKLKGKPVECSAAPGQDDPSVLHCGPDGHFRCSFFSKIGDRGICCEKLEKKQIKCPPRMGPVMEKDGNVRACNPRRVGSCRTEGSVCVFDEEQGDFHCCQVDMSEYEDEEDELEASTMNYLAIGMTNQLRPPKYIGRPRKYSKDIEEINGCRGGEIPFLDQNKGAMECTADKVTCPPGFQCYRSRRFQRYICCGMNRGYCPSNSAVLMGPKQRKVSCGTLSGCPEGFYCHKSSHTCCSLEPTAGICEQGLPFINSDGKARYCEQSCPKGYTCTKRFRKSVCCPSTENVCSQPVNIGLHCLITKSKKFFFYHSESGECRPFIYTGCSGNDNRFETIRQCEDHCHLASICPVGSALRLANGNMATCSAHQPCPLDEYSCHSTDRGNFCCPNIENFEICPADQKPYIVKGRPVECHKSSECPNSFECHRPNYHSMGHCCAQPPPPVPMPSPLPIIRNLPKARPIYTPRCSNNKAPLKAPDDEIQICIPGKELECPNGYFCELDDYLGRYQCCPTNSPTVGYQSTCSSGFDIHLDSEGAPVFCDPEEVVTSCHKFGECKYSQEHENFVCCAPNSLEGMLKIENNSSPKLWSGILPGGHGCISDTQCEIIFPNARCDKGRCKCPGNLKAYQGKCEADCPQDYAEIDGICLKESTKRTKT